MNKTQLFFIGIILSIVFCSCSLGDNERKMVREGNKAYQDSIFDEAEVLYRKALDFNPTSFSANYNIANTTYKQQNFKSAVAKYERLLDSLETKEWKASTHHNLGNSYLHSKELDKAIEAYKNALRNNPDDKETKYNLMYAMNLKEQQKQQQQKQNKDQKQQDKQDKKDQQDKKDKENKEQKKDEKSKQDNKPKDGDKEKKPQPKPQKDEDKKDDKQDKNDKSDQKKNEDEKGKKDDKNEDKKDGDKKDEKDKNEDDKKEGDKDKEKENGKEQDKKEDGKDKGKENNKPQQPKEPKDEKNPKEKGQEQKIPVGISKEDAKNILDAIAVEEKEAQKKVQKDKVRKAGRVKNNGKKW